MVTKSVMSQCALWACSLNIFSQTQESLEESVAVSFGGGFAAKCCVCGNCEVSEWILKAEV